MTEERDLGIGVSADEQGGASAPEIARTPGGGRVRIAGAAVLILAALAFLVSKGLGTATVYFREADEAVEQLDTLGTRRIRVEGIVVDGSIRTVGEGVRFRIEKNGTEVLVTHRGDPPELFQPNIPVVLEGRFAPGQTRPADGRVARFDSDRVMVKHTNEYREENPDRVDEYVGKELADGPVAEAR